jgi:S-adenosylmethionine:tRNA ribosyltransferase-isomerase
MQLAEFDFPFDSSLIAAQPENPRDHARLLLLDRPTGTLRHHHVSDLPSLLEARDLVVANDTKVLTARVAGRVVDTGRMLDILFVRNLGQGLWEVLLKGRLRAGQVLEINDQARLIIVERGRDRTTVRMEGAGTVEDVMRTAGMMPLPPYIKRAPVAEDRDWYQTMFARSEGAIAAPTAGLHFTERLLSGLKARGIGFTTVTLHVGPGTFRPVTSDRIEDHRMEAEIVEVGDQAAGMIQDAKAQGGRIVAIGTTVTRALETAAKGSGQVESYRGPTSLFISPGFVFRAVDILLTNFHLPRTTLLMLVSAFAGTDRLREAYGTAVAARYRFYSYGDAMLIR